MGIIKGLLGAIGMGAVMSGSAQAQNGFYKDLETPRYTVERVVGAAQVRAYDPYVLAVVAVRGDQRSALTRGFQVLAGYIFGGNGGDVSVSMTSPVAQSPAKIAMTSPVAQTGSDDLWEVTFMMPTQYTLDTLPTPNNDAVRFIGVPPERRIALPFSGRANTRTLDAKTAELRQIANEAGLAIEGDAVYMFYDGPMTLPARRRNEVAFTLE